MYRLLFFSLLAILPFSVEASESEGVITSGFGLTRICQDQTCSVSGRANWLPTINANTPGLTPVTITDSGITGYVWGNEIGWVNLSPTGTGVTIDPLTGQLSGNAYANTGSWINFNPTQAAGNPQVGVRINSVGEFTGWAYVSGIKGGWMEFSCPSINTCIKTDWRPVPNRVGLVTTSTSSSSSGASATLIKQADLTNTSSVPVINDVVVSNVSIVFNQGLVTITWNTDTPTDSIVTYREVEGDEDDVRTALGSLGTTVHKVTFSAGYGSLLRINILTGISESELVSKYEYSFLTDSNSNLREVPSVNRSEPGSENEVLPIMDIGSNSKATQTAPGVVSRSEANRDNEIGDGGVVSSVHPPEPRSDRWLLWLWVLSIGGLVSLFLRPLTSSRINSLNDAVLTTRRMFGILMPRHRRVVEPWGTVYDSKTKRALDPAYVALLSIETGEEVTSAITDMEGRYGFLVKPGRYRIETKKSNYSFPSQYLLGHTQDHIYSNLYFGETFTVADNGEIVRSNVPMDKVGKDWNEEEKVRMGVGNQLKKRQLVRYALNLFFILGVGYSMYAWIITPGLVNSFILVLYAVIWLAQILWRRRFPVTTVTRRGIPLSYALIKIFSFGSDSLLKTLVTDEDGQFYTLVPAGAYRVEVEECLALDNYTLIHTIDRLLLEKGVFQKDIKIG